MTFLANQNKAWLLIPHHDLDRYKTFERGLQKCGYKIQSRDTGEMPDNGDVLVCWNLTDKNADVARRFAYRGNPVIVAENGYISKDAGGRRYYALALDGHNGSGRWFPQGPMRWQRLEIKLRPWRKGGKYVLVCAQRGLGSEEMRMPAGWPTDVRLRLEAITDKPVVIRRPPSRDKSERPLLEDLAEAHAVVVWTSNVSTLALAFGVPVFFEGPHVICEAACQKNVEEIDAPLQPDRRRAFSDLAWAQWNTHEIASGDPFRHLLGRIQ